MLNRRPQSELITRTVISGRRRRWGETLTRRYDTRASPAGALRALLRQSQTLLGRVYHLSGNETKCSTCVEQSQCSPVINFCSNFLWIRFSCNVGTYQRLCPYMYLKISTVNKTSQLVETSTFFITCTSR